MKIIKTSIGLDDELLAKIKFQSSEQGLTVSEYIRKLLLVALCGTEAPLARSDDPVGPHITPESDTASVAAPPEPQPAVHKSLLA